MTFKDALAVGKKSKQFAEDYFKKQNISYKDVRDDKTYRKIDVDYLTDIGKVEVKLNFYDAMKGHKGWYFWIEISIDDKPGWWQFNQTDYFLFHGGDKAILIKNDDAFKNKINYFIENGDHSERGLNRFDYKQDRRYDKYVTAKCMRVYLEDLNDIEITKIIKRKWYNES
jgi:hypothetical protein